MINVLRAEWIKLRTVTMNWVLGIIAVVFPLAVTLLTAYFKGDDTGFSRLNTNDFVSTLTGTSVVSALLFGVMTAASITGEYGFGTIRPTFAATPRRTTVIVAKAMVAIGTGVMLVGVVQLVGFLVGRSLAEGQGATIDLALAPTGVPAMVGVVLLVACLSLAGYGFGMITRSTPAAVSILIVWPLIAENLVGQLLALIFDTQRVAAWMPFRAGIRMAVVGHGEFDGPSRLAAGIYFGAVSVGIAVIGGWIANRRDA